MDAVNLKHGLLFLSMVLLAVQLPGQDTSDSAGGGDRSSLQPLLLTGRVFEDVNENGRFDEGDTPMEGVVVSDQVRGGVTNEAGRYSIRTVQPFFRILYVEVPRGYLLKTSWFQLPGAPSLAPDRVERDFALKREEPVRAVAVTALPGIAQAGGVAQVVEFIHQVGREVNGGLVLVLVASAGLSSRDGERLRKEVAAIGSPVRFVPGQSPGVPVAQQGHVRGFGPTRYSFWYADRRFVVPGSRFTRDVRSLWTQKIGASGVDVIHVSGSRIQDAELRSLGGRQIVLALEPGEGERNLDSMRILGVPFLKRGGGPAYRWMTFDGAGSMTNTGVSGIGETAGRPGNAAHVGGEADAPVVTPTRHVFVGGHLERTLNEILKESREDQVNSDDRKSRESGGRPPRRVSGEVVAHRGGAREVPENTMSAAKYALAMNVEAVEIDVRLTSDHKVVLFHDAKVSSGPHSGRGFEELSWEDVSGIDVGGPGNPESAPLLADILALGWSAGTTLMIELKNGSRNTDLVSEVVKLVSVSGKEAFIVWGSFDVGIVRGLHLGRADIPLVGIVDHPDDIPRFGGMPIAVWAMKETMVVADRVTDLKKGGARIWAWTVNDVSRAGELLTLGIDAIITDCPAFFLGQRQP